MTTDASKRPPLKHDIGEINDRNIGILKKLTEKTFPIKYGELFYKDVLLNHKFSRYAFVADVVVGGICARVQEEGREANPITLANQEAQGIDQVEKKEPSSTGAQETSGAGLANGVHVGREQENGAATTGPGANKTKSKEQTGDAKTGGAAISQQSAENAGASSTSTSTTTDKKDEQLPPGTQLYIMTLSLLPAYRKRGIASALLKFLLEAATKEPQLKKVSLHVQTGNDVALEFYKKHGFRVEKTVENYYDKISPASAHYLTKDVTSGATACS
eukprot:g13852.t1